MSSLEHCLVTPPLTEAESGKTGLSGDKFELQLRTYTEGEIVEGGLPDLGEEVGAILEGSFAIDAAGEHYELSAGEAIVIPPHEPRQWRCQSATGVLYRAVVRLTEQVPA